MNTLLGLLSKGNLNCAGREISDNLFGEDVERPATLPSEGAVTPEIKDKGAQQQPTNNAPKPEPKEKKEEKVEKQHVDNEPEEDNGPTKFRQWKDRISGFIRQMTEEE